MRNVEFVKCSDIVCRNRARKAFTENGLVELAENISNNQIGMLHPIIIKNGSNELVTGERRFKVISQLHEDATPINFVGEPIPFGTIPVVKVDSKFELLEYLIAEAAENNARESFTWQERAELDKRIVELKQIQINLSKREGEIKEESPETLLDLLEDSTPIVITKEAIKAAVQDRGLADTLSGTTRLASSVKLANALEDPEMSEKLRRAGSRKEAEKILAVEERKKVQQQIAIAQGKELRNPDRHTVVNGDCLVELAKLETASMDLCLCDPIYGINAHKFGVAKRDTGFHDYEDTIEEFERLLPLAIKEVSRILKPAAHMYLFCDLSKFYQLKKWIEESSLPECPWTVQSFPLHWIKVNGSRCPHPGFTYRKTVEYIVFAYRGGKQSNHQLDSHFEVSTKRTEVHGATKEPDGLKILLQNSAFAGDTVLDFMAGSGSLAVACHELKMKSFMIEKDPTAYGRCVERIKAIL